MVVFAELEGEWGQRKQDKGQFSLHKVLLALVALQIFHPRIIFHVAGQNSFQVWERIPLTPSPNAFHALPKLERRHLWGFLIGGNPSEWASTYQRQQLKQQQLKQPGLV